MSNFFKKNTGLLTANYLDCVSVICIPLPVGTNRVSCSVWAPSSLCLLLPASDLSPPELTGSGVLNTFQLLVGSLGQGPVTVEGSTPCLSSWKCPTDSTAFSFALSFLQLPCPSVSATLTRGTGRTEWTCSAFEDMRFGSLGGGMLRKVCGPLIHSLKLYFIVEVLRDEACGGDVGLAGGSARRSCPYKKRP